MKRRQFLVGLGSAAAWPLAARSQPRKISTILWVSTEAQPDPFIEGFREGMRGRGYAEGQNLAFVLRYAPGDPAAVRAMLPELLAVPADLIVSSGPAILAMKDAVGKPVLFAISGDPVALGIAQSLSQPGRNFTGTTFLSLEVAQKRVQLLREMLPGLRTLAILSQSNHPGEAAEHAATKAAASALGLELAYVPFPSFREFDDALARVAAARADAMLVYPDGVHDGEPSQDRGVRARAPAADHVRLARILRRRGADELRREPEGDLQPALRLRRPHPARREPCGHAD